MPTIQIPVKDLLKAEEILSSTGATCSMFPQHIYVVSDQTLAALKAGGVRIRPKDPRSARPPWLMSPVNARRKVPPQ